MHDDLRGLATWEYHGAIKHGLAREVARIDLPLSTYTYWYWKIDLHNLFHFLGLRLEEHAQWEIRQYAQIIAAILKKWVPDAWGAFEDYQLNAVTFSRLERELLLELVTVDYEDLSDANCSFWETYALTHLNMSKREFSEFFSKINQPADIDYQLPEPKDWSYFHNKMQESAVEK